MRKLFAPLAAALVLIGVAPLVSQAAPAAATGRLSADLAAALDTAAPDTAFLVFVQGTTPTAARDAVADAGLESIGELASIGVPMAIGTPAQLRDLVDSPGIRYIERDRALTPALDTSRQAVRATEAMAPDSPYAGIDGSGQTIAIVDSGVDGTHPMFQVDGVSKVVRNLKVACVNHIPGITIDSLMRTLDLPPRDSDLDACPSRVTGEGADDEPLIIDMTDLGNDTDTPSMGGHGTHVAGIAAGVEVTTEEATPRTFSGMAPGAKIVSISQGQVLTIYAENTAFDWILRHHDDPCGTGDLVACPPITVVNSSFGSSGDWDPDGVTTALQRELVRAGITMVWANGNSGGDGTDNLSSNDGSAQIHGVVSVANYDDGDTGTRDGHLDDSSSRGLASDPLTWPDLSAPGTAITSACRPYLAICTSGEADPNYGTIGGTSMASPHVAGAVALIQQAARSRPAPDDELLTPAQVEDLLEDTAHQFGDGYEPDPTNDNGESSFDKGHGLLDVVNALNALFGAEPTSPGGIGGGGAAACAPGTPLVTDAEGDATGLASADTGSNVPTLDVTSVDVAGDPEAETLVVTFHVADLTAENPEGTTGISFEGVLHVGDRAYDVNAERTAQGETGDFDVEADTVTVTIPRADLDLGGTVVVDSMTDGISRRSYDPTPIGPLTDSWEGACPQTVQVGGAPVGLTATAGSPATWSGAPTTTVADPTGLVGDQTIEGTQHDARAVEVVVADGGTVTFDLDCDQPWDDFDITLKGPDGKPIGVGLGDTPGRSAEATCVEQIVVTDAPSGTYTATVSSYLAVGGTYAATISVS